MFYNVESKYYDSTIHRAIKNKLCVFVTQAALLLRHGPFCIAIRFVRGSPSITRGIF
jgi:hypothetical protein